jgi:RND family efflux transporter MFP subunit
MSSEASTRRAATRPEVSRRVIPPLLICLVSFGTVVAQGMPPMPVRYTEAREHDVQKILTLPGSVESPTVSLVASEVPGLVAEAQMEEAKARLKLAELSLERARRLHGEKILSQQELDNAFYEFNAWQGRVDQLDAEIQQTQHDLKRSVIRAPFAGTIVSKRTEVGEWLDVGSPVVEIVSLDVLEVRVDVPERYFERLSLNASAVVTFDSLPDYEVKGRVSAIIPRADPQARTFPVKVRLENTEGRIGVGMLAQVSVPAGETYRAVVIPKDAVIRQGVSEVVYRMNGDDSVEVVTIVTGAGVGSWIAVNGPIEAGHRVITRGNERLSPGQTVQGELLEYALP